jgi:hypothetical protein
MNMGIRESFSNANLVFMEEEQSHPWLRSLCIAEGFCSSPPLRAKGSLRVFDDYSRGQLDDVAGRISAADLVWRLDTRAERYDAIKLHTTYRD